MGLVGGGVVVSPLSLSACPLLCSTLLPPTIMVIAGSAALPPCVMSPIVISFPACVCIVLPPHKI